ncbi:helix-turn-helix transcriptional regulator [Streptomyces sp. H27-C3]|uniref:helix-turn-helix domain-containing protein n=1 Tax=Streptomyces sp. H27-C3 TaxID=3046305 RepID=UPI0024B8CC06|nr:helix-turn-helix transcriptional regulator [Streptomyces sp. H27-C3]MDJ0461587.1 helix-turn-helix transcriptional regulator [Streptomyces sp. H27-C3]
MTTSTLPLEKPSPAAGPLTPNQLVSHNLARARKSFGLTQSDLAQRMEEITGRPWSNASVSAAERAWKGGRTRRFDANEIVALSLALDVPPAYFFLAPDDAPKDFELRLTDDAVPEEDVSEVVTYRFDSFLRMLAVTQWPMGGFAERMEVLFQKYLAAAYEPAHELSHFNYEKGVPVVSGSAVSEDDQRHAWQETMDDVAKQAYTRALLTALAKAGAGDLLREAQRDFERRMDELVQEANGMFEDIVDKADATAREGKPKRAIRVRKKRKDSNG